MLIIGTFKFRNNIFSEFYLTLLLGFVCNFMQWLPSLALLVSIAVSFWTVGAATYLPTIIFGTYISWIYLRYWQRKPEAKLKGDPSDDFAFSTFFPELLRYIVLSLSFFYLSSFSFPYFQEYSAFSLSILHNHSVL